MSNKTIKEQVGELANDMAGVINTERAFKQKIKKALQERDCIAREEERESIYYIVYKDLPTGETSSWDWVLWAKDILKALEPKVPTTPEDKK